MFKRLSILMVLALTIMACANETQQKTDAASDGEVIAIPVVKVEDFESVAENYVDQNIEISGLVDHTCKHSGKRMVIVGDNPDYSVKIESGEIDQFNRELEGREVKVIAKVTETRVDANYLDEWEQEVLENHADNEDGGADELARIENMRMELKGSEKGYLAFYGLSGVSYEVTTAAETPAEDAVTEEEVKEEETKK